VDLDEVQPIPAFELIGRFGPFVTVPTEPVDEDYVRTFPPGDDADVRRRENRRGRALLPALG
jgi:hypothetical protein